MRMLVRCCNTIATSERVAVLNIDLRLVILFRILKLHELGPSETRLTCRQLWMWVSGG